MFHKHRYPVRLRTPQLSNIRTAQDVTVESMIVNEKTPIGWYRLASPYAKNMYLLVSTDRRGEKKYGTLFMEDHVPRTTLLDQIRTLYLLEVEPCIDPLTDRENVLKAACEKHEVFSIPQMRNVMQKVPTHELDATMERMREDSQYGGLFRARVLNVGFSPIKEQTKHQ